MANRRLPIGVADGDPLIWDRIWIDDLEFPGVVTVEVSQKQKKDEKKSKGQNGAEVEYAGAEPAKVSIVLQYITDDDHVSFVEQCFPLIRPNPDKTKVTSKKINNAVTDAWKISAIHVDEVEGPSKSGTFWQWKISATEARPPTSKNATGTFGGAPPKNANCQAMKAYRDSLSIQYINNQNEYAELLRQRNAIGSTTGSIGGAANDFFGTGDETDEDEVAALSARIETLKAVGIGLKTNLDLAEINLRAMGCPEAGSAGRTDP